MMIKYLTLRVKHFKEVRFIDNCDCAVARAAKEKFKTEKVSEGVDCLFVNEVWYNHKDYDKQFKEDYILAKECDFDNSIIRTIRLIKIE